MEPEQKKEIWWKPALLIFGTVSTWIVIPIVLALIAGKQLDTIFDTKPWIFLMLTFFAFGVSTFGIVRTITKYMRDLLSKEKKDDTVLDEKNG